MKIPRIGTDIDGVIADFNSGYLNRFGGFPKYDWCITRNVNNILVHERDFWLNLPVIRVPNFTPRLYCSARVNNKRWTKKYLKSNGLNSPLYQVPGYNISKYNTLKGRVDVFIDDSIKNFIDLNLKGLPCLLMDTKYNREWGPIGRIFSLNIDEILEAYNLFKNTVFDDFKSLINE
jgi:uncharacterized HAD superfamily protein